MYSARNYVICGSYFRIISFASNTANHRLYLILNNRSEQARTLDIPSTHDISTYGERPVTLPIPGGVACNWYMQLCDATMRHYRGSEVT